jgi:hypothetical protein
VRLFRRRTSGLQLQMGITPLDNPETATLRLVDMDLESQWKPSQAFPVLALPVPPDEERGRPPIQVPTALLAPVGVALAPSGSRWQALAGCQPPRNSGTVSVTILADSVTLHSKARASPIPSRHIKWGYQ